MLKALSWARLVWDLGEPPADLVHGERRLGRAVVEKVARQLAASFPLEQIVERARAAVAESPSLEEMRARIAAGQARAEQLVAELRRMELPHLPTAEEIRSRAEQVLAATPSLDEIVERTRELLLEVVSFELLPPMQTRGA